jgi:hypothetical protein
MIPALLAPLVFLALALISIIAGLEGVVAATTRRDAAPPTAEY